MEVVCEIKKRQKWLKLVQVCILLTFREFIVISRKSPPLLTLRTRKHFWERLKKSIDISEAFCCVALIRGRFRLRNSGLLDARFSALIEKAGCVP